MWINPLTGKHKGSPGEGTLSPSIIHIKFLIKSVWNWENKQECIKLALILHSFQNKASGVVLRAHEKGKVFLRGSHEFPDSEIEELDLLQNPMKYETNILSYISALFILLKISWPIILPKSI